MVCFVKKKLGGGQHFTVNYWTILILIGAKAVWPPLRETAPLLKTDEGKENRIRPSEHVFAETNAANLGFIYITTLRYQKLPTLQGKNELCLTDFIVSKRLSSFNRPNWTNHDLAHLLSTS